MGKAAFVIYSAVTALAAGTWEFMALELHRDSGQVWGEAEMSLYFVLILPAVAAAAISAYARIRDPQFHQRSRLTRTFRVCFHAYIAYMPFLAACMFLAPSPPFLDGWGTVIALAGIVWIPPFSIIPVLFIMIPVLYVQYMIDGMARSRGYGA